MMSTTWWREMYKKRPVVDRMAVFRIQARGCLQVVWNSTTEDMLDGYPGGMQAGRETAYGYLFAKSW